MLLTRERNPQPTDEDMAMLNIAIQLYLKEEEKCRGDTDACGYFDSRRSGKSIDETAVVDALVSPDAASRAARVVIEAAKHQHGASGL